MKGGVDKIFVYQVHSTIEGHNIDGTQPTGADPGAENGSANAHVGLLYFQYRSRESRFEGAGRTLYHAPREGIRSSLILL